MPDCKRGAALIGRLDELVRDAATDQRDALAAAATLDARLFDLSRGILAMAALAEEVRESQAPDCARSASFGVRVAIYIRARSENGRRSAQRQQDHLAEIVTAHERWRTVRVFTDWSGTRDHRPALAAALAQARVGCYDLLAVHTPDRLARDPRTLLNILTELSDSGVAVLFGSHLAVEGARCPR
jgi:hypothetical protein